MNLKHLIDEVNGLMKMNYHDRAIRRLFDVMDVISEEYGEKSVPMGVAHGVAGSIYISNNDPSLAEQQLRKAVNILEPLVNPEDDSYVAAAYHNLGVVYFKMSEYDDAEREYLHALQLKKLQKDGDVISRAITLNNLGTTYLRKSEYDVAEYVFTQALEIFEKKEDYLRAQDVYLNLASLTNKRGQTSRAMLFYENYRKCRQRHEASH